MINLKCVVLKKGVNILETWVKDVIQIVGTIGTLLAARSARKSAQISNKQLDTQIEEKKRIDRPRLVPLNHKVSTDIYTIFSDWKTKESDPDMLFKPRNNMSRFFVPIINTGNTHAFDVRYSFELMGDINSFRDYEKDNIRLSLAEPELKQLNVSNFNFIAFHSSHRTPDAVSTQEINSSSSTQYIPLIQNNKSGEMHLPKFFVILSNAFLAEVWEETPKINRPEVILTIRYKDQLNVQHVDQYLMTFSTKFISASGTEVNAWIDFNYINPSEDEKAYPRG